MRQVHAVLLVDLGSMDATNLGLNQRAGPAAAAADKNAEKILHTRHSRGRELYSQQPFSYPTRTFAIRTDHSHANRLPTQLPCIQIED